MYNNQAKPEENIGKLKISQDVLETIANQASLEVPGVYALAKNTNDFKSYLQKKTSFGNIVVKINEDLAIVDVALILKSGYKIEDVAQKVQKSIKDAIQTMTGVVVSNVNVIVEGIYYGTSDTSQ